MSFYVISLVPLAFAAAGLASLLRALPWPAKWLQRKPLACPVCMGMHAALLVLLLRWEWPMSWTWTEVSLVVREYLALGAVAALVVAKLFPPPIELPPGE